MSSLVRHYGSHQTGAPVLSGLAGAMTDLLDACLVNGYNTKTITITRSGSIATATCSSHGFTQHTLVVISGADQSDYNGEFYVDSVATDSFTFTVANSPVTPATGTISCKVQSAGWTKEFSGTQQAVYRAPAGNRYYLRVDDDQTSVTNIRGYVTMADINTGTEPFPTVAQQADATGSVLIKSSLTTSAVRDWRLIVNDRCLYFYHDQTALFSASGYTGLEIFGDFVPYNASDAYNTLITVTTSSGSSSTYGFTHSALNSVTSGLYFVRRPILYVTGAYQGGRYTFGSTSYIGYVTAMKNPQVFTGKIYTATIYLHDADGNIIGEYPGAKTLMTSTMIYDKATIFEGTGDLAGNTYISLTAMSNTSYICNFIVKIRGTWGY